MTNDNPQPRNAATDVHLLREYAGRAMQALIREHDRYGSTRALARDAYRFAAEMVEEDERLSRERIRAERKEARNG